MTERSIRPDGANRHHTRTCALLVLVAAMLASRAGLARVATRLGPGNRAELYTTEDGRRFLARGVNYVRLGTRVPGARPDVVYHKLFCPGSYPEATASAALREIRDSGYNVVRVFLTPSCMTIDMPAWTLNATVVSHIANFLWHAQDVGIKVVLTMDSDVPPGYLPGGPQPPHPGELNDALLRADHVSARGRFWADLLVMLDQQAPRITEALLSIDIANEPALYAEPVRGAPFDRMSGSHRDFGRSYDLASPVDRQQLADAAFARYVSWVRGDIARARPGVLVTVGVTPPHEVKLAGYNGLDLRVSSPGRPADEYRYPPRLKVAEPYLDYYSIHSYPGGTSALDYLTRTLASIEYATLDLTRRPIELGELGASRATAPTAERAAGDLAQFISLVDQLAFAGYTMWSWDTAELPGFWTMKDAGGTINGAVSPAGRPSYGAGGLAAGLYSVQGTSVIFHNGRDAACTYASWNDFTDATGLTSTAGLPTVLGAGAVRMTACPLIARSGPFQYLTALYYSNGVNAYCYFASWPDYVAITGLTTLPDSVLHRLPDMRFDGACRR